MGRADITPDEAQALQDQVDTLMGRADITTEEVQALQDQVDTLIGRADITPDDLQALEQDLEQALTRSWTPLSSGTHLNYSAGTSQDSDAEVTMIGSDGVGTFHVTYVVDGIEQRIRFAGEHYRHEDFEPWYGTDGPPAIFDLGCVAFIHRRTRVQIFQYQRVVGTRL